MVQHKNSRDLGTDAGANFLGEFSMTPLQFDTISLQLCEYVCTPEVWNDMDRTKVLLKVEDVRMHACDLYSAEFRLCLALRIDARMSKGV